MSFFGELQPPLHPRNGSVAKIVVVTRVSSPGLGRQDERSLEDQLAMHHEWLDRCVDVSFEIIEISGSGSGEWLGRAEYLELTELVEAEEVDLVLTEDLGRILRRMHAHLFAEHCVDHGTRLIAVNDNVDTAQHGWQDSSIMASWHHERSNRDTSDRIKRTANHRFSQGGCAAFPIAGYIKPPGSKNDSEWKKDPDWEPVLIEWFRMLDEDQATFSEIADWLNTQRIPTGPHCRNDHWDGPMVGRVSRNHLLKGVRLRNQMKSERNGQGKYVSVKAAPHELKRRHVPHLAFFDESYYDRVISEVDARNAHYRRKGVNGKDTRRRVPKKRTRFPGQSLVCGICGRGFVFGGHGQKDRLMCSGARQHKCWNGVSVDGPLAAERIASAVLDVVENLPEFDEQFLSVIEEEQTQLESGRKTKRQELCSQIARCERELENLTQFVRDGDSSDHIRSALRECEDKLKHDQAELCALEQQMPRRLEIPTLDELKSVARSELTQCSAYSWEFCRIMQKLTKRIVLFPYRLCNGGDIVLKARFRLMIGECLRDRQLCEVLRTPLEREIDVNLFDPPDRERVREQIAFLRQSHTLRKSASIAGVDYAVAERATKLQRFMESQSRTDPYDPVTEPADDMGRLRRHKHARYEFDPLPDAGIV